jgi:acyl carrier protein
MDFQKPNREEIKGKTFDIVADQMGIERSKLTEETNLINDLGADSLDTVELIMEFEDMFDLNIPDEEAEKVKTIKDIIDGIFEKLK